MSRTSSTTRAASNRQTSAPCCRRSSRHSLGSSRSLLMWRAICRWSPPSTRTAGSRSSPACPALRPPTTTPAPAAIASSRTMPKLSPNMDGKHAISASASNRGLSRSAIAPAKVTADAKPRRTTSRSRAPRSGPSPATVSTVSGWVRRTSPNASTSPATPFLGTKRPRKTMCRSCRTGRTAPRAPENAARSTMLGMIRGASTRNQVCANRRAASLTLTISSKRCSVPVLAALNARPPRHGIVRSENK